MSQEWCTLMENKIKEIEGRISSLEENIREVRNRLTEIEKQNSTLIRVLALGLLGIVATVVGVKIF